MAIQFVYTDPVTGAISANAHMVLDDPIFRGEVQHVLLRGRVYASKADFDAGLAPLTEIEREYGKEEYDQLRAATMPICEGWVIASNPPGAPVPDMVQVT